MRLVDYHVHERHSADALDADVESYVKRSELMGIDELAFTTHLIISGPDIDHGIDPDEIPEYIDEIRNAQENTDIKLRVGFEVDYFHDEINRLESLLDEYSLDFILGSIHYVNGWDIGKEKDAKSFFTGRPLEEGFNEYFDLCRMAVESGLFDIMAHPDYFRKCLQQFREPVDWSEYGSKVYNFIDSMISYGVGFEVNTSGKKHGTGDNFPVKGFLEAAREAGVKRVTVGSDSHTTDTLGKGIEEALRGLANCGYNSISVFKDRRRTKIPIEKMITNPNS
jgi:histidinol-phosphatase (PHP family)